MTLDYAERIGAGSALAAAVVRWARRYAMTLRDLYAAAKRPPSALLAYGAGAIIDRLQAERMAHLPGVELIAIKRFAQHNVLDPLIRRREYLPLLNLLLFAEQAPLTPRRAPALAGASVGEGRLAATYSSAS